MVASQATAVSSVLGHFSWSHRLRQSLAETLVGTIGANTPIMVFHRIIVLFLCESGSIGPRFLDRLVDTDPDRDHCWEAPELELHKAQPY